MGAWRILGGGRSKANLIRHELFEKIASIENIFLAWREFRRGKSKKADVQMFELALENNLFTVHDTLVRGEWKPQPYQAFCVSDPKLRHIHKATVRDRVVHQAIFRILYPIFDRSFIFDSYSCRERKGTHAGSRRLDEFVQKSSRNFSRPCWVLKCDIRKFFDSVDHERLLSLLSEEIMDMRVLSILKVLIRGFAVVPGKGLPLGNVTSQLFANVYMNPFDQFAKRKLKAKYYIRYCDDFVMVSHDHSYLLGLLEPIRSFLGRELHLELHPGKISVRKVSYGIDFLGYVTLPHHKVMRMKTMKRLDKKIAKARLMGNEEYLDALLHAARGITSHSRNFGVFD